MNPFVSIIVPVFNGEKYIESCIESLLSQTYPEDRYEVIVVDNGSSDKSLEITKHYNVTSIIEKKKGSYAARNSGIKKAKGEIIGFTDVDCIASNDWVEKAINYFLINPSAAIVSGRVDFFSHAPATVWGYFDKHTFLNQEYSLQSGVAKTANLFVKKSMFEEMGLFDDDLSSGGDVYWTAKATNSGVSIYYEVKSVVQHPVRNSFNELSSKCYRVGLGKGQILKKNRLNLKNSTFSTFHLKHPFNLLRSIVCNEEKKVNLLYPLYLSIVVLVLGIIFLFGIFKGLLNSS